MNESVKANAKAKVAADLGPLGLDPNPTGSVARMRTVYSRPARVDVLVGPPEARLFLRRLAQGMTERFRSRYARKIGDDMTYGRWDASAPAQLVVNTDGDLCDGQHRLVGVLLSGRAFRFSVVFGVSSTASAVIDIGRKRSIVEQVAFLGGSASTVAAAAARCILVDWLRGLPTDAAVRGVLETYRKELAVPIDAMPSKRKGISRAHVVAPLAVAIASGEVTRADVVEFCEVLATGQARRDRHGGIVRLREFLVTARRGATAERQLRLKTQLALQAFVAGDASAQLRVTERTRDVYGLPIRPVAP